MIRKLTENRIAPFMQAATKKDALQELAALMHSICSSCGSQKDIAVALADREQIGSTGIGDGVAIPHGKLAKLPEIEICFGRSVTGVPFAAADNKPVHLFFVLLAPADSSGPYLKALARLARFLKSPHVRSRLLHAEDAQQIAIIFAETSEFT